MIKAPKGTADVYGADVYAWQRMENVIRRLCADFCLSEIRTPAFEFTSLFRRGAGETSDVVKKEMFTFEDRGGRSLSLRPEMTAGVARAFVETGLAFESQPTKLYYVANAFRAERPQAGRMVELHQFGVEYIGSYAAAADAEVIAVAYELLRRLNVKNVELRLNSLGCENCRAEYVAALKDFIAGRLDSLCPACRERAEINPLRVLDCKNDRCQEAVEGAPSVIDFLDEECSAHFREVQTFLTGMGIAFVVDPKIARGLDYYTRTVFEFVSGDLGGQSTVCGGGRYDSLIKDIGGPDMGACGFGLGLERLLIILEKQGNKPIYKPSCDAFVGYIGEAGLKRAVSLTYELRKKGISAECDTLGRNVKAQIRRADKLGAKYSLVIGENELVSGSARVKDMRTGEEISLKYGDIGRFILGE